MEADMCDVQWRNNDELANQLRKCSSERSYQTWLYGTYCCLVVMLKHMTILVQILPEILLTQTCTSTYTQPHMLHTWTHTTPPHPHTHADTHTQTSYMLIPTHPRMTSQAVVQQLRKCYIEYQMSTIWGWYLSANQYAACLRLLVLAIQLL